jgi:hypothetical protein
MKLDPKIQKLVEDIRESDIDHFDLLDALEKELGSTHSNIRKFNSIIPDMIKARKGLPSHLAKVLMLSQVLINRLAMQNMEIYSHLDKEIEIFKQSYLPEKKVDFDNLEF